MSTASSSITAWFRAGSTRENNTLHVMDDQARIALIRVGAPFPDDATPAVQFHLGDHLGSSHVVMDDTGTFINREEYTPYGETSFGSFARKRYRFTGKERDEESGLNYHGARYYAPWLARWVSPDPLGPVDGVNLYPYARNNPIRYTDRSGGGSDDAKTTIKPKPTPPKPPPSKPFIDISNANLPTKQGIELPKPQKPSAYPWPKDIPRDPKLPDSSKPLGDVPKPQPPTNPPRAYPDTPVRPAELDPPLFDELKTPLKKPTGPLGTVPKPPTGGKSVAKAAKGVAKGGAKMLPIVGTFIGVGLAIENAYAGDYWGGGERRLWGHPANR